MSWDPRGSRQPTSHFRRELHPIVSRISTNRPTTTTTASQWTQAESSMTARWTKMYRTTIRHSRGSSPTSGVRWRASSLRQGRRWLLSRRNPFRKSRKRSSTLSKRTWLLSTIPQSTTTISGQQRSSGITWQLIKLWRNLSLSPREVDKYPHRLTTQSSPRPRATRIRKCAKPASQPKKETISRESRKMLCSSKRYRTTRPTSSLRSHRGLLAWTIRR